MKPSSATDLKVFAWIGVAAIVCVIMLPVYLGYIVLMNARSLSNGAPNGVGSNSPTSSVYSEPLGEAGSHCGGPAHLPCRPGLACSSVDASGLGICQAASSTHGAVATFIPLGGSCALADGRTEMCAPDLFCQKKTTNCQKLDGQAPHVQSLKLQGFQPVEGRYEGSIGTRLTILVEAVNADRAHATVTNDLGKGQNLGDMKREPGGKFGLDIPSVDASFSGILTVTVTAKNGDQSSLAVQVDTLE